jgi:hypothetical protein
LLDRGKDRLEHRSLDKPGALSVGDHRLAEAQRNSHLAGDRHDHDVAPTGVGALALDDDGRTLLGARLIRERKRHEHNFAETES